MVKSRDIVFKNYNEYWHFARFFSQKQRKSIFFNLSKKQKEMLNESFIKDGWNDLINRNEINDKIARLEEIHGINVFDIRIKAMKGKSIYISTKKWTAIEKELSGFPPNDVRCCLGGLVREVCDENKEVSLVTFVEPNNGV